MGAGGSPIPYSFVLQAGGEPPPSAPVSGPRSPGLSQWARQGPGQSVNRCQQGHGGSRTLLLV